jgi:hypothetical protein
MPLDDYEDPQLAAVAALVQAAVRRDLDPDVLRSVYEDPRDIMSLANSELPAMAIYRHAERHEQEHSHEYVDRVTVRIDYLMPDIPEGLRPARWPALRKVWRVLAKALVTGKHEALVDANDAQVAVLENASVECRPDRKRRVTYGFAKGGGNNFPFFRAEVDLDFWPLDGLDVSALSDFLTHVTVWAKPGDTDGSVMTDYLADPAGEATDADFHVDDHTTLTGFSG